MLRVHALPDREYLWISGGVYGRLFPIGKINDKQPPNTKNYPAREHPRIMEKPLEKNFITDTAHIGGIVRQARREAKLAQAEAAALCKVGTRFLSELEHGKPRLQIGKVLQVLRAFGLTMTIQGGNSSQRGNSSRV